MTIKIFKIFKWNTFSVAPGISFPINSNWSLESGYSEGAHEHDYPLRVKDTRPLTSTLHASGADLGNNCGLQGFKLFLTTPGEIVSSSTFHFKIDFSQLVTIGIKPKLVTTSNDLRHYKPAQRQCFFESERQLRYFKMYTKTNCEMECLFNFTKKMCGCEPFYMRSKHFLTKKNVFAHDKRIFIS